MSWVKQGKAGENRGVLFCICTVMMDGFARNGHSEFLLILFVSLRFSLEFYLCYGV